MRIPGSRRLQIGGIAALAAILVAGLLTWGRSGSDPPEAGAAPTTAGPATTQPSGDGGQAPPTSGGAEPALAPPTSGAQVTPTGAPGQRCDAAPAGGGAAGVVVDGRVQHQVMEGFGTTIRLFDDPHLTETFDQATARGAVVVPAADQAAILDRLYRDLGLTRVRPATDGGVEVENDNGDPAVTDLSKFRFEWKRNDGFVDLYKQQLKGRGASQVFLSPVSLEKWQKASTAAEYVEWAMVVIRRWRSLGVDLPYFSVVNEPGGTQDVSGEFIRDVIKQLGPKLRAEGFATKMLVPDDINPREALSRLSVILDDPAARQYVGAIGYHLYGNVTGRDQIKDLGARYGLPVWMTEFYQRDAMEWANTVHETIESGASAVDYLWGYFGQWRNDGDQLITVTHTGDRYTGYELNKQYYSFGQFSRFVAPGSQRVAASSSVSSVRTTAYVKGDRVTVVAINNGSSAVTSDVALVGVPCGTQVQALMTDATSSWKPLAPLAVNGGRFSATLAPGSVTTFTSGR